LTDREDYRGEPSAEEWLAMAEAWTEPLVTNSNVTDTHDLGFLAKPFESAMQIQDNDRYLPVLQNMSLNLAARFEPNAGVIRSWDCGNGGQHCSHEDSVLVIIDNMMVSGV
jgi:unsaturated chondroitin disaccharide hydrolase